MVDFCSSVKDPSDTIVIAGSGRSGTTLLLDIIGAPLTYRKIFEPLHPGAVPGAENYYYRYVRPYEKVPDMENFMRRALTGKINNSWTNESVLPGNLKATLFRMYRWRWWAPDNIMKIIRGNLMLGWLESRFGCKIIFIVRHPCAVVESWKRMGWTWKSKDLERVLSYRELMDDYLYKYMDVIDSARTTLQKYAVLWSIENKVPLEQLSKGELSALLIKYEDMILYPEKEFKRIKEFLNLKKVPNIKKLQKRSRSADKNTFTPSPEDLIYKWKKRLTEKEIEEIMDIVKRFEIDIY